MERRRNGRTISVLIDAENSNHTTIAGILAELSKHGVVQARTAYGDWSQPALSPWPAVLARHAIQPHQNFAQRSGKNASDIALVIDAMDMLHGESFDAFAIVSSDGDFSGLASRLRRAGRFVFGFGEAKTPASLRNACDDFLQTDLLGESQPHDGGENEAPLTLKTFADLLRAAADTYGDAEGWTHLGAAGSYVKRQRPDFQPRALGSPNYLRLLERLSNEFETRRVARGDGRTDLYRPRPTPRR